MMIPRTLSLMGVLALVAACQSPSQTASAGAASPGTSAPSAPASATAGPQVTTVTAFAATQSSPGACTMPLAGGPPPKPDKGADFAKNAVGKNLARNVGRNVLGSMIGGGVIGATVASQVVRTEQDLGGKWMVTDGSSNCGCEIQVRTGAGVIAQGFGTASGYRLKDAKGGNMSNISCSNPHLAQVRRFALGYSFTGYDAVLAIEGGNGQPVAQLKRDGINYFSGALADGTPVTMWRRGG
ncbi:hypothetical protein LL06_24420 [Hoeflea sp. BAL378]|uniref:hypothetical protein n=1 Tax=Hoeflea sp. BAL378 TaxID=1547437 RepID=UPI0005137401|nr:hypothetical protein [Hoeflea sp. BAL378]KGF67084.1 hypothetical protein LL06_24420 [Hoeflea sp. BAL378]